MNIQELAKQAGFEQVMRHRDGSVGAMARRAAQATRKIKE